MGLVRTTPPTNPTELGFLKLHLRLDTAEADEYLLLLAATARERIEEELARSLLTQTWTLSLERWPDARCPGGNAIRLPRGPVQAVTSVKYRDSAGTLTTLDPSAYVVDTTAFIPTIAPVTGTSWPAIGQGYPDAVQVVYTAGYGTEAQLPAPIRHATMILTAHLWEHPELAITGTIVNVLPWSVDALIAPYRILDAA